MRWSNFVRSEKAVDQELKLKPIAFFYSSESGKTSVPVQSSMGEGHSGVIRMESWVQPDLSLEGYANGDLIWIGTRVAKQSRSRLVIVAALGVYHFLDEIVSAKLPDIADH